MDNFNSDQFSGNAFYGEPKWDDFTIDDEKRARRSFSRFSLAVFLYMFISTALMILSNLVILIVLPERAQEICSSPFYLWAANIISMYVLMFPVLFLIVKKMRKTVRVKSRISLKEFLKLILVSFSLMYIGNLIASIMISFIEGIFGKATSNPTGELIESSPIWLIIIVAVIIGPIVEELIFRKLMMDRIGVYGDRIAIVFSSIMFGIFHGNIYQLFYATLLGLLLAYVYSRTSDIRYPILIHMIVNFFGSVIPMLLTDKLEKFTELYDAFISGAAYDQGEFLRVYAVVGTYSFLTIAFFIAGLVILIKSKNRIFVSDRCEVLLPKEKRIKIIAGNVGFILFASFMIINMIINIFP